MSNTPSIVVTGLGVVHNLGEDPKTFWDNLVAGKSGIGRVSRWDPADQTGQVGSECVDFDPTRFMDPKEVRRNDRVVHLAIAAGHLAVQDAGLDVESVDKERMGVVVGTGIGGMASLETQVGRLITGGPRKVSPFMTTNIIANMPSGLIALEFGAMGPNFAPVSACSTSTHALGESLRIMERGEADIMLAGGSEASVTPLGFAGFNAMKAMATKFNDDPRRASRPFDADRDGFVMGEGAAILVLETEEHAKARGAKIYARLTGYAATCDAHHMTAPDPEGRGLTLCLNNALRSAGLSTTDIDYVNAHGTSTQLNDRAESAVFRKVFGSDCPPISSTKSMTGHLLGAAGSIEAIACVKAIENGILPPTVNYETPDPACDLDYVPNEARKQKVRAALSDNLGFGGHNAVLIFTEA